jgi:C1A family cysteine protease
MKFPRIIAAVLIMIMTSSPVLAADCAVACATGSMMTQKVAANNDSSTMSMSNCHMATHEQNKNKTSGEHKDCAMAGCNLAQTTPAPYSVRAFFPEQPISSYPSFDQAEASVDLSPPLKPPA